MAILNYLKRWVKGLVGDPVPKPDAPPSAASEFAAPATGGEPVGVAPSTDSVSPKTSAAVTALSPALENYRAQCPGARGEPAGSGAKTEPPTGIGTRAVSASEPLLAVDGPLDEADISEHVEAGGSDPYAVSLGNVLRAASPSVRLSNIIHRNALFEHHNVRDFLEGRLTEGDVLKLPNCGPTTLFEMRGLVRKFVSDVAPELPVSQTAVPPPGDTRLEGLTLGSLRDYEGLPVRIANRLPRMPELRDFALLEILDDPAGSRRRLRAIGAIGAKSVDELFAFVTRLAEDYRAVELATPAGETRPDAPSAPPVPVATVAEALASLSEKHKYVLTARYGLDGSKPLTLEEVAQKVFVTRERVRQVQKAAVKALTRRPWFGAFEVFLQSEGIDAWALLARGREFVPAGEFSARTLPLPPQFVLAVDVVHGDIRKWLMAFAVGTEGGWLAPGASAEIRQAVVTRARDAIAKQPLPYPVADLAEAAGLSERDFIQALSAMPAVRFHEGYIHSGYFGSKTRRAARLHRFALAEGGAVVDAWRLHVMDADADHTDERSARMVLMQLGENPQLFAPLFDHLWIVLGRADFVIGEKMVQQPALKSLNPGFEEGSLTRWLWRRVSEVGPMRLSDLRDDALEAFPTASGSSVGPIMQMHPVFYRVAPGVFDVRQERPAGVSPALLTDFQGRAYARARRGGAGRLYFSGWTDEFEWRLCEWARRNGDQDVFRSLLEVCDPSTWPVSEAMRSEWAKLRKLRRRWSLATERRAALGAYPPDEHEFFAGLAHLVIFGSIGWIGADRIMQNRLGSQGATDLLALLAACGAADAPDDWQLPHKATPLAAGLLETLTQTLRTKGALSWTDVPLTAVLERSAGHAARVAWAQAGEVNGLLQVLITSKMKPEPPAVKALAEADDLFESDEWDSLFRD